MVASAISRLSVGDHAVVVARPTCRPPLMTGTADRDAAAGATGQLVALVQRFHLGPVHFQPHDLPLRAPRALVNQRRLADERALLDVHQPAQPHFGWRVALRPGERFLLPT